MEGSKSVKVFCWLKRTIIFNASHILGFFVIFCVAVLWVSSSAVLQMIMDNPYGESFDSPVFLSLWSATQFALYLPFYAAEVAVVRPIVKVKGRRRSLMDIVKNSAAYCRIMRRSPESDLPLFTNLDAPAPEKQHSLFHIFLVTFSLAVPFTFMWLYANISFTFGLRFSSVGSATVLSSTSSFATLGIMSIISKSWPSIVRVASCIITFVGVVLVIGADDLLNHSAKAIAGDVLTLSSAMMYGGYCVYIGTVVKHFKVKTYYFLGCVGIITIIFYPLVPLLDILGIMPAILPPVSLIPLIIFHALIGAMLSDLLWALSVRLTTPLVSTVGLSLTIPMGLVFDFVFHGELHSPLYFFGSGLVLLGFLIVNFADRKKKPKTPAPEPSEDDTTAQ